MAISFYAPDKALSRQMDRLLPFLSLFQTLVLISLPTPGTPISTWAPMPGSSLSEAWVPARGSPGDMEAKSLLHGDQKWDLHHSFLVSRGQPCLRPSAVPIALFLGSSLERRSPRDLPFELSGVAT